MVNNEPCIWINLSLYSLYINIEQNNKQAVQVDIFINYGYWMIPIWKIKRENQYSNKQVNMSALVSERSICGFANWLLYYYGDD